MKPHAVHLSTVHLPGDVRIFHKMCCTLAGSGYRVTFIVPAEADGHENGVAIRALPPRRGFRRRIANLLRMLFAALGERGDVYHFHDPELLLVGAMLKLFGKRVIYDAHEDVPKQILTKHWIPQRLRSTVSRLAWLVEYITARLCDRVVAATPAIARKFPSRKTTVVQNFPLRQEIAPLEATPFCQRPANVIYVGGIAEERGIRHVVAAMEQVTKSVSGTLTLAGACQPQSLADELEGRSKREFIEFHGWCSREEVQRLMATAYAGIVTFLPLPNHIEAQPNKLFEYMSAGLPVIASDFPLWRAIVESYDCGILVDPQQPDQIADAIAYVFTHPQEAQAMGRRGRQAVEEKYNWDQESEVLRGVYAQLLKLDLRVTARERPVHPLCGSGRVPSAA